jgi:hypothetical protein
MQVPLQQKLDEFTIVLCCMYPKSLTHHSAMSPKKNVIEELKQKCVVLTLYLVSVTAFSMQPVHSYSQQGHSTQMMDSREINAFISDMYYAETEGETILKQEVL